MDQAAVKITFYLKRDEMDAKGYSLIMGRLVVGQSESVFSAKMLVPPSLWSSGRAKGKTTKTVAAGIITADPSGVLPLIVSANIKAILKNGILHEDRVFCS